MNYLTATLNTDDGRLAYFENDEIKWTFNINCSKYLETDGKYYYAFSQGSPVKLYSFYKEGSQFVQRDCIDIDDITISHLKYNHKYNVLFCSCMDTGYYHAVKVEDGCFKKVIMKVLSGGCEPSRCHQILFDKSEEFAIIVNIRQDILFFNKFDGEKFEELYQMKFEGTVGPRHVLFSKSENLIYLVTEKSNEVMVIDYKKQEILQRFDIFKNPKAGSKALTFCVNEDFSKVWIGLRGQDIMTEYDVLENEFLQEVCVIPTFGKNARNTIISSDFKYLINANIDSNNITFVDVETRQLAKEIPLEQACSIIEVL